MIVQMRDLDTQWLDCTREADERLTLRFFAGKPRIAFSSEKFGLHCLSEQVSEQWEGDILGAHTKE